VGLGIADDGVYICARWGAGNTRYAKQLAFGMTMGSVGNCVFLRTYLVFASPYFDIAERPRFGVSQLSTLIGHIGLLSAWVGAFDLFLLAVLCRSKWQHLVCPVSMMIVTSVLN